MPTERITVDEEDQAHADEGRLKARKRMQFPRASNLDEFYCHGSDLIGRLAEGHMVIQVTDEGEQAHLPGGPGRSRSGVVFLEISKGLKRKSVESVVARFGKQAKCFGALPGPADPARSSVHALPFESLVTVAFSCWRTFILLNPLKREADKLGIS